MTQPQRKVVAISCCYYFVRFLVSMVLSGLFLLILFVTGKSRILKPFSPHENNPGLWNGIKNVTSRVRVGSSFIQEHLLISSRKSFVLHHEGKYPSSSDTKTMPSGIAVSKPRNYGLFKYHRRYTSLMRRIPKKQYGNEIRSKRSGSKKEDCSELSKKSNCTKCGFRGICSRGTACMSDWLAFALKSQRELQVDIPLNQQQMLAAHNAYNNRASGYGDLDDCVWPPPYQGICISLANQELSFTDLLNIGIQSLEIDPWYCYGRIHMSHSHSVRFLGCMPWDRELEDGLKEIGAWVNNPENAGKIIQIYLDDGHHQTQGYHELVNGPIKRHFGDKVFTPEDLKVRFNGKWPSPREMRVLGKTVWFVSMAWDTHGGLYIHRIHWKNASKQKFVHFHNCTTDTLTGSYRIFADSTRYGPFYDGPSEVGVIMDFKSFLMCGVNFPAADQVSSELVQTAIFTWAEHEPRLPLSEDSCVLLSSKDQMWHVANCSEKHSFACVSDKDDNHWMSSTLQGLYRSTNNCPKGFSFSIPHNGIQHRKLVEVSEGKDVWLNFTPYIPLVEKKPHVKPANSSLVDDANLAVNG